MKKNTVMKNTKKQRIAFFDLDHTITNKDSGMIFILNWAKKHPSYWWKLILSPIAVVFWKTGIISLKRLKEWFFSFIKGLTLKEIKTLSLEFTENKLISICKPEAVKKLNELKRNGYKILLISASPSFLVESIAMSLGIEIYSGTEYLVLKNRYTGKIKGSDCRGPEKIIRIESLINLKKYDLKNSLAFSDSKADIPMLSLAGESWLVDKKIWKLRKFDR